VYLLSPFGIGKPNFEKMKSKRDIEGLTRVLTCKKDKDYDLRMDAIKALAEIGGEQVVEGLITALKDPFSDLRIIAITALGQIGDTRAVNGLVSSLDSPDSDVRVAVTNALGGIGGDKAFEGLLTALKDKDYKVRQSAIRMIGKIGGSRAVEILVTSLHDPEWLVRRSAAESLGEIDDKLATEGLAVALRDSGYEGFRVRESAMKYLIKNDANYAVKELVSYFKSVFKDTSYGNGKRKTDALHEIEFFFSSYPMDQLIVGLEDQLLKMLDEGSSLAAELLGKIDDPLVKQPLEFFREKERLLADSKEKERLLEIGTTKTELKRLYNALWTEDENKRRESCNQFWTFIWQLAKDDASSTPALKLMADASDNPTQLLKIVSDNYDILSSMGLMFTEYVALKSIIAQLLEKYLLDGSKIGPGHSERIRVVLQYKYPELVGSQICL
jgi:hypothetical protein